MHLFTDKPPGWEADEPTCKQEDLEVTTALGMAGTAQATLLRRWAMPIARSWWYWELELHCISYVRFFYIVMVWYGAVTKKRPKKPLVWAQLFHTKLHYYSSSHPWNSGKKTRRRLQATLAPCFLARPSIQPNIQANRRARRLRQVAIQASISPVTQSFQPTQWTASTNHPRQEPLCLPWLQRRAGKTRPARLSLAPPNTQQREWLRKHAETGIITGKEAGSLDSLKR